MIIHLAPIRQPVLESFPGHKGRPGRRGGSLPSVHPNSEGVEDIWKIRKRDFTDPEFVMSGEFLKSVNRTALYSAQNHGMIPPEDIGTVQSALSPKISKLLLLPPEVLTTKIWVASNVNGEHVSGFGTGSVDGSHIIFLNPEMARSDLVPGMLHEIFHLADRLGGKDVTVTGVSPKNHSQYLRLPSERRARKAEKILDSIHEKAVKLAIQQGRSVPKKVLDDYPSLRSIRQTRQAALESTNKAERWHRLLETFHGHRGRPGRRGGSVPRDKSKTHADPWDMSTPELKRAAKQAATIKYECPEGYVLGFHRTRNNEDLQSILQTGLQMQKARGSLYNEPNAIWAYTEEASARRDGPYVVFRVPEKSIYRPNDVSFNSEQDIPAKDIIYGHKYYHIVDRGLISGMHYLSDFHGLPDSTLKMHHEMFKRARQKPQVALESTKKPNRWDRLLESFAGHRGRPGKRGGSLPRKAGSAVYLTPEDVEQYSSWGEIKYALKKDRRLITKPMSWDELPETLYHVTTRKGAVEKSGFLLGQSEGGGMGGGNNLSGVSFTTEKLDADLMVRELTRAVSLAKKAKTREKFVSMLDTYAAEDVQIGGGGDILTAKIGEAKESALKFFDVNAQGDTYTGKLNRLAQQAYNSYLTGRSIRTDDMLGGGNTSPLRDPLLMAGTDAYLRIKPEQIGIVAVPRERIPKEALIRAGSDDFLHEIRVHADVPLSKRESDRPWSRLLTMIESWEERPVQNRWDRLLESFKGHRGRPGKRGGSLPRDSAGATTPEIPEDYSKATLTQKLKATSLKAMQKHMGEELAAIHRKRKSPDTPLEGTVTKKTGREIGDAMREETSAYESYLAGDAASRMGDLAVRVERLIQDHAEEFADVKAEDLRQLSKDFVRKLVYQEVMSNRNQYTDHGIRHLTGNIVTQEKLLDVMEQNGQKVTGRDRLLAMFVAVNHDVGYTTDLVSRSGLPGVMASKDHPLFSTKIAMQQAGRWNRGKIFSPKEYATALRTIRTHDRTTTSGNVVTDAVRFADNLSLFAQDKLPSMFRYVKGGERYLIAMGQAAKNKDTKGFERLRTSLDRHIDKSALDVNLKRDLRAGVAEIGFLTPKFTLGVLAGEIATITKGTDAPIAVSVRYNAFDKTLQSLFDMGQKQTKKFLSDYGVADLNKSSHVLKDVSGKSIMSLTVVGAPKKESFVGHRGRPGIRGGSLPRPSSEIYSTGSYFPKGAPLTQEQAIKHVWDVMQKLQVYGYVKKVGALPPTKKRKGVVGDYNDKTHEIRITGDMTPGHTTFVAVHEIGHSIFYRLMDDASFQYRLGRSNNDMAKMLGEFRAAVRSNSPVTSYAASHKTRVDNSFLGAPTIAYDTYVSESFCEMLAARAMGGSIYKEMRSTNPAAFKVLDKIIKSRYGRYKKINLDKLLVNRKGLEANTKIQEIVTYLDASMNPVGTRLGATFCITIRFVPGQIPEKTITLVPQTKVESAMNRWQNLLESWKRSGFLTPEQAKFLEAKRMSKAMLKGVIWRTNRYGKAYPILPKKAVAQHVVVMPRMVKGEAPYKTGKKVGLMHPVYAKSRQMTFQDQKLTGEARKRAKSVNVLPDAIALLDKDFVFSGETAGGNTKAASGVFMRPDGRIGYVYPKVSQNANHLKRLKQIEGLAPHWKTMQQEIRGCAELDNYWEPKPGNNFYGYSQNRIQEAFSMTYLIQKTGIRASVAEGKSVKTIKGGKDTTHTTYGASTLRVKHVAAVGDTVRFSFPAKRAKKYNIQITDKLLAQTIRKQKAGKGPDDRLWSEATYEDAVKAFVGLQEDIVGKRVVGGLHVMRHMFATTQLKANAEADLPKLRTIMRSRKTEKQKVTLVKQLMNKNVASVAKMVNDKPGQIYKSYGHPAALKPYLRLGARPPATMTDLDRKLDLEG